MEPANPRYACRKLYRSNNAQNHHQVRNSFLYSLLEQSYTYVKQGSISATDFEPISFTPALLAAEPKRGFQPSRLDTLVLLFTGRDPALLLSEAIKSCTHDNKDSCDCPPVTIDIPPVLAYHTATLRASATSVEADFTHWQNRGQHSIARSFRHPSGKLITISRPYDSLPSSQDSQADYWQERTLGTMLNQWYEQGIALYYAHQAVPATGPLRQPKASSANRQ